MLLRRPVLTLMMSITIFLGNMPMTLWLAAQAKVINPVKSMDT